MACTDEYVDLIKRIISLNHLQEDKFSKKQKLENSLLKNLLECFEHINNNETIYYPRELVNEINSIFKFEFDQQDSYELFHRILEISDSFIEKFDIKKS